MNACTKEFDCAAARKFAAENPRSIFALATRLLGDDVITSVLESEPAQKYGPLEEVRRVGIGDLILRFKSGCSDASALLAEFPDSQFLIETAAHADRLKAAGC